MSKHRILIFLIGISLLILVTHSAELSHSKSHRHHRYQKEHLSSDLLEEGDYKNFIQKYSLPFFNMDNILDYFRSDSNKSRRKETKEGYPINLKTGTQADNYESLNGKKENSLKQTNTKPLDSRIDPKNEHDKFYTDLNHDYIRSRLQKITGGNFERPTEKARKTAKKEKEENDEFSLEGNIHDVQRHLANMKQEKEEKKDRIHDSKETKKKKNHYLKNNNDESHRKDHILRSRPTRRADKYSKTYDTDQDDDYLAYKDRLGHMDICEPYNYSKKTYDMSSTEDSLSERLNALNGSKSFNKESKNVAIAKANNSKAVAKGNGAGRAIASSSNGGQATAISLGGGEAISEVKQNGKATAISHGKGSSVAKSHGQGVSEAISKGDGKALAISSDNSYSRAVAIGNSNSTALSADNACALSTANSNALSDAQATRNSTALANSKSRANSLAVATDNAFANATANANSVALSTANENSIANSNANSDAEALAKASGNGITQVLANANSQAIAESKDNSVVIVESNAQSKAAGEANSPIVNGANGNLVSNKPVLKLRGSDLNRNHNYGSFLMIKKIELPKFSDNRNMFDYLNLNLDDDASVLVNANAAQGGLFSFFSGSGNSQNTTSTPSNEQIKPVDDAIHKVENDIKNNNTNLPIGNLNTGPSEITKQQIIEAIINAPLNAPSHTTNIPPAEDNNNVTSGDVFVDKPVLSETVQAPSSNVDLIAEKEKHEETKSKIDLSKIDSQNEFVKDLIKKINNEDCILNYDAGPIFNTNAKTPEAETCNNDEKTPLLKTSLPNNVDNENHENSQQQLISNYQPENNQICANSELDSNSPQLQSCGNTEYENNENKSFLKATENNVDKNLESANCEALPENLKGMNLPEMQSSPDGLVYDKHNNRIIVDDSDGKNKKIRVNQSLNFSKNQVNKNFSMKNSDFNMKNSVENLSDKEVKHGKDADFPEDYNRGAEENHDHDYHDYHDDHDDFLFKDDLEFDEPRRHKGYRKPYRKFKSPRRESENIEGNNNPKCSKDQIAEFDDKYFNADSAYRGPKNYYGADKEFDGRKSYRGESPRRPYAYYNDHNDHEYRKPNGENSLLNSVNEFDHLQNNSNNNTYENNDETDSESIKEKIPADNIMNSPINKQPPIVRGNIYPGEEEFSKLKSTVNSEAFKDKIHSIWTNTEFKAIDVACSNKGDIMAIGEDKKLYKYFIQKNVFELLRQDDELSNLKNIDLGPDATPFATTENGNTYFLDYKNSWIRLPGCATDISIGKNGEIFKLGCTNRKRGYSIYQFSCIIDGESTSGDSIITKNLDNYLRNYYKNLRCKWNKFPGFAKTIVVGNDGLPFIISKKNNFVYKSDGKYWDAVSGVKAKDFSVSNENVLFIVGMDSKIYEVFNDKDSEVVLFDSIAADKISTGPYSRPSIIKSSNGLVYTSSKI